MDRMVDTDSGQVAVRYSNLAVAIHWITAVLILTQVAIGLEFADMAKGPDRSLLFTWHKTIGVTILLLAIVRLIVRLMNPPPPFPAEFPKWERFAAVWNHRLFYFLIIALPVTGLSAVSDHAVHGMTTLIGGLKFPVIPLGDTGDLHVFLVWTTIALLAIHVGAALKQQFFDRSIVAGRMPPFRSPRVKADPPAD